MFQEEMEKLQLKVVEYQEQLSRSEVQQRRLGDKVAFESARANEAERQLKTREDELVSMRADLNIARRSVEHVAALEAEVAVERDKAKNAHKKVVSLSNSVEAKDMTIRDLEEMRSQAAGEVVKLSERVEPLETMVESVKQFFEAMDGMGKQIGLLLA